MKCTQLFRHVLGCFYKQEQEPIQETTTPYSVAIPLPPSNPNLKPSPSFEEGRRRSSIRRNVNIPDGLPLIVLHDVENKSSVLFSAKPVKQVRTKKRRVSRKKKHSRKHSKGPELA